MPTDSRDAATIDAPRHAVASGAGAPPDSIDVAARLAREADDDRDLLRTIHRVPRSGRAAAARG